MQEKPSCPSDFVATNNIGTYCCPKQHNSSSANWVGMDFAGKFSNLGDITNSIKASTILFDPSSNITLLCGTLEGIKSSTFFGLSSKCLDSVPCVVNSFKSSKIELIDKAGFYSYKLYNPNPDL